ncbi:hypothetical protein ACFQX9_23420 [Bradyrhizobium sp. GCM10028915]|uniref:hypothetical protein n=1 Tax=Bradyrhizobium sp. GCM10028915 TaxID=3273385 RepID=UPI003620D412
MLEGVDGRSAPARRYRDVLAELISDLGGDPSGAQSAIARRASALCVVCEQAEAEMVAGGVLDLAEFTTAANSLRRLLSDLGLERRARDVTPSLASYLASKATERAKDSFAPLPAISQRAPASPSSGLAEPAESPSTTSQEETQL